MKIRALFGLVVFVSIIAGVWCAYVVHELKATLPTEWQFFKRQDGHAGVLALIQPGDEYSDMRKTKGYDIITRHIWAADTEGYWQILVFYVDEESEVSHAYIEYGGGFDRLMPKQKTIIQKAPNQRLQTMRFKRPHEFNSTGSACLTRNVRQTKHEPEIHRRMLSDSLLGFSKSRYVGALRPRSRYISGNVGWSIKRKVKKALLDLRNQNLAKFDKEMRELDNLIKT